MRDRDGSPGERTSFSKLGFELRMVPVASEAQTLRKVRFSDTFTRLAFFLPLEWSEAMAQIQVSTVRPAFVVRRINFGDLRDAISKGVSDFSAQASHIVFLCLIYPAIGVCLAYWASGKSLIPLLYPLMSGFALMGPFVALGLYEVSRRREQGLNSSWKHAFSVVRNPASGNILLLGAFLAVLFIFWIASAQVIYSTLFGRDVPDSYLAFYKEVLSSHRGWQLIVVGNIIGFAFALIVFCISVISFPLMLDRNVNVPDAMATSFQAVVKNPIVLATWGLIIAGGLVVGFLTAFVGLAVIMPILGHATWHLYRRLVSDRL
jgi:uncharacterized membrane protein